MGLGSSKVDVPTLEAPSIEGSLSELATVDLAKAQAREQQLASQLEATRQQAQAKLGEFGSQLASVSWKSNLFWYLGIFLFVGLAIVGGIFIYDYYAIANGWTTVFLPTPTPPAAPAPAPPVDPNKPVTAPTKTTGPSLGSKFTSFITGSDSSGDLVSSLHDATSSASIPSSNAPLSNQTQGAYGLQWWMFVKDWNYGYGKEKSVVVRPDPTNNSIMNPSVSLHPTDNTLKVSISIFPQDSSASKTEPAPATSSGASTDDVFICEVPNIPLQTWFSVGVSVFGKNVDIYIDGKLVKSCMLPGVPKPATGDIQVSPNGGFSGYVCNMYHYPRMLTPSDAMTFHSAGSTCSNASTNSPNVSSGYSVKFGVYDTLGKQIQQYTF